MSPLEKALRWIAIGGLFMLPFVCLIVADGQRFPYNLFFPFITGKNFTFRLLVEISTGAWLALALVYPAYRPRRSWLLGAFAVFVFVMALADAFGAYPFKSFWSNYERMDGWVTLAHLLALLVVAVSVMRTEKIWRRFWQTSLGVSVFVGFHALFQLIGLASLGQGGAAGLSARLDATFGNPIYLAVYMLFHIFIAAHLWVQGFAERKRGERAGISLWYGFVIALDAVVLFFTGTRGTMLGLIGGVFLSALLLAMFRTGSRMSWRYPAAVMAAIVLLGGAFWSVRDAAWVHRVGFLERLATISVSESTIKARFLNMGMAWQGVKERPLLGWGQENYALVFDKYYDPRMYGQEPWFDRVHNAVFDWLVAGGFLGLLSYLSIFGAALWLLWRDALRRTRDGAQAFSPAERAIFTGLLAAYFFHNLTVFDNITSYILFACVLAYLAWRSADRAGASELPGKSLLPSSALPYAALASALLVWGVAWWVNAAALSQNRTLLAALSPQSAGIARNLGLFKEAAAYGSYGTQEAREQFAQAATQVAGAEGVQADLKRQFLEGASAEMRLQAEASPLDARFPLFLGVLHDAHGDYEGAFPALEKAHELSPRKQTILFEIAGNQSARGDLEAALATLKSAYELEPDYELARMLYAALAVRMGRDALADELLSPVRAQAAASPQVVSAYVQRKRYDALVQLAEARVEAQPGDAQGYFTLAAAYYAMGSSAKAIEALERASSAVPGSSAQAQALIQQIKNGTAKVGE